MKTIVINSQKGGSGKSMLAKHLSVEAIRAGDGPVFLIDTDTQGTLTTWHSRRESETPALVDVPLAGLARGLELIKDSGAAFCLIDTPSGELEHAEALFKLADFVIFPVQDSDDDLAAAPATVAILRRVGTPFVFVLTKIKPNTLVTAQVAAALSKHGQVATTFVADRTAYKSRYPKGQTITEAEPNGKAAREVAELWDELKSCLHASMNEGESGNMGARKHG